jgi:hypothetical protein
VFLIFIFAFFSGVNKASGGYFNITLLFTYCPSLTAFLNLILTGGTPGRQIRYCRTSFRVILDPENCPELEQAPHTWTTPGTEKGSGGGKGLIGRGGGDLPLGEGLAALLFRVKTPDLSGSPLD